MTFIIAEISASHDGKLDKALDLVATAAEAGADAIKLQTFEPEQLASNRNYVIQSGPWKGQKLYELYKKAHTPKKWHKELFDLARELEIEAFSTPFHQTDVDFLETLNCPRYKISSFDIINSDLIKYVAQTGKPIIISVGMATYNEIWLAYSFSQINGPCDLTLLHCISAYPTELESVNLKSMQALEEFTPKIGISDHSQYLMVPVLATAMGASVIEKHIALDRSGLDGGFALLPGEFELMVKDVRQTELILGNVKYGPSEAENSSFELRPSLYYASDLKSGTILKKEHFYIARPNLGEHPRMRNELIGSTLKYNVSKGDPVEI